MSTHDLEIVGGIDVDVDDLHLLSAALQTAARQVTQIASSAAAAHAGAQPALLLTGIATAAPRTVVSAVLGSGVPSLGEAAAVCQRLADLGLQVARAATAYDGAEAQATTGIRRADEDLERAAISAGYLTNLLRGRVDPGPFRGADPDSLADGAGPLADLYPHRAAIVGPPSDLGPVGVPRGLADLVGSIHGRAGKAHGDPPPGRVDVLAVTGADGRDAYVVALPGTSSWRMPWEPYADDEPRDTRANLDLVSGRTTAELAALPAALAAAGVPRGAKVAFVGHSQGGLTAYAAAGEAEIRARYQVTHVVTAGSPIAAMAAPAGVRVITLENRADPVPRLDGRAPSSTAERTTVTFSSSAEDPHDLRHYEAAARGVDESPDPRLRELRASFAQEGYLASEDAAARARLTRVELRLDRPDTAAAGAGSVRRDGP